MFQIAEPTVVVNNNPTWFDWIVLGLGVLAFIVAMWQIFKTNGAAKSAKAALSTARDDLLRSQITTVFTDLRGILNSIDSAYANNQRAELDAELGRFTFRAFEASEFLQSVQSDSEDIQSSLRDAAMNATKSRSRLSDFSDGYLETTITNLRIVVPQAHALGVNLALGLKAPDLPEAKVRSFLWFKRRPPAPPLQESTVDSLLGSIAGEALDTENTGSGDHDPIVAEPSNKSARSTK